MPCYTQVLLTTLSQHSNKTRNKVLYNELCYLKELSWCQGDLLRRQNFAALDLAGIQCHVCLVFKFEYVH